MLNKEDRVRKEYVRFKKVLQLQYVHLCKDCGIEMLKTPCEERVSTGYCVKCVYNHKKRTININENGDKECKTCQRYLPLSKFIKKSNGRHKIIYSTKCSKCHNLTKFGINSIDFEKLVLLQDNKCAICGSPEMAFDKTINDIRSLAVDHDHITGKVRGLLCTNCNILLGQSKDSTEILEKAILYLKLHTSGKR